jgi:hypothetical protein
MEKLFERNRTVELFENAFFSFQAKAKILREIPAFNAFTQPLAFFIIIDMGKFESDVTTVHALELVQDFTEGGFRHADRPACSEVLLHVLF